MLDRKSYRLDTHGVRREVILKARSHRTPRGLAPAGSSGLPLAMVAVLGVAGACGQKPAAAPSNIEVPATPQVQATVQPLKFEFKEPKAFTSADGSKTVAPPDLDAETWRVMVNQNEPMQYKNPLWQALAARETVELQMTPGWKYRCIVPPLEVTPQANEWGTDLSAWLYKRTLLCSNDDFKSWSEAVLNVRQSVKGKRKVGPDAGILLRERADDGSIKQMFVVMRSDKENKLPTYGPPQVIAGRKVGDDDDDE
jgi:hypothetical protein